jgi:hypothetical protein
MRRDLDLGNDCRVPGVRYINNAGPDGRPDMSGERVIAVDEYLSTARDFEPREML